MLGYEIILSQFFPSDGVLGVDERRMDISGVSPELMDCLLYTSPSPRD